MEVLSPDDYAQIEKWKNERFNEEFFSERENGDNSV